MWKWIQTLTKQTAKLKKQKEQNEKKKRGTSRTVSSRDSFTFTRQKLVTGCRSPSISWPSKVCLAWSVMCLSPERVDAYFLEDVPNLLHPNAPRSSEWKSKNDREDSNCIDFQFKNIQMCTLARCMYVRMEATTKLQSRGGGYYITIVLLQGNAMLMLCMTLCVCKYVCEVPT